jgi:hypothetical protein
MKSLKKYILEQLESGRTISRLSIYNETYKFKTPSCISDLRAEGHDIKDRSITKTNRLGERVNFKEYWIEQPRQGVLI